MSDNVTIPEASTILPDDDMLPVERENWLRERGVLIETVSDRRRAEAILSSNNDDNGDTTNIVDLVRRRLSIENNEGTIVDGIKFVHIPQDDTKRISTLVLPRRVAQALGQTAGDVLPTYIKSYFADGESLDVGLFEGQAKKQNLVGSEQIKSLGTSALANATSSGSVETFPLVRPSSTNKNEGVYIYLDEVGLLKKLPINKRASQLAYRCGYNPAPNFYGDVFVGRVRTVPHLHNVNMTSEDVIDTTKEWLVRAPQENTAWQQTLNEVTGRDGQIQPDHAGTEGKAVLVDDADGCSYSWTQNEEEIEITISMKDLIIHAALTNMVHKKSMKVVFQPQQIIVKCNNGEPIFDHKLYSRLDIDGCTWTLDKNGGGLVITVQKANEGETWPRLLG